MTKPKARPEPRPEPPRVGIEEAIANLRDRVEYARETYGGTYHIMAEYTGLNERTLRMLRADKVDPFVSTLVMVDQGITNFLAKHAAAAAAAARRSSRARAAKKGRASPGAGSPP